MSEQVFKNLAGISDEDYVRRVIAKALDNLAPYPWSGHAAEKFDRWLAAHDAAIREECAKVADVAAYQFGMTIIYGHFDSPEAREVAARIRALNEEATHD